MKTYTRAQLDDMARWIDYRRREIARTEPLDLMGLDTVDNIRDLIADASRAEQAEQVVGRLLRHSHRMTEEQKTAELSKLSTAQILRLLDFLEEHP